MATIIESKINIENVPQGYTLAAAFSTDMNWTRLPELLNNMFSITERDHKKHKVGSVAKIDNLYMLFVKESSYDAPMFSALIATMEKLAKKVKKNGIKRLAIPKICTGKNGFDWFDVYNVIEEAFADVNVEILTCSP